jgi:hypothetical protein
VVKKLGTKDPGGRQIWQNIEKHYQILMPSSGFINRKLIAERKFLTEGFFLNQLTFSVHRKKITVLTRSYGRSATFANLRDSIVFSENSQAVGRPVLCYLELF